MSEYTVTMRHDNGTIDITTSATSAESAAAFVCAAEGAPTRSVVSVTPADAPTGVPRMWDVRGRVRAPL
jgi:hypothetical protein